MGAKEKNIEELLEQYKNDYAALEEKYNVIVIELKDTQAAKDAIAALLAEKELIIVEITDKNVVLSTDLANALAKNDALIDHNNRLIKTTASQKEAIDFQEGLIKELQQELTAAENNTLIVQDVPTVKHEGEVYEIHARAFRLDGQDHTLDSLKDPVIVGRLLEKKVGFLIKK